MKIALIGNGPSWEAFKETNTESYDIIIGCNKPPIDVDYSVIVDFKALLRFAREQKTYDQHKYILAERLKTFKGQCRWMPGAALDLIDGLIEYNCVDAFVDTPDWIEWSEEDGIKERYLSSGHAGFVWILERYPNAEIHMFGFDSLTRKSSLTVSDYTMGFIQPTEELTENPKRCSLSGAWHSLWDIVFDYAKNKVYLHDFKDQNLQTNPEKTHRNLKLICH